MKAFRFLLIAIIPFAMQAQNPIQPLQTKRLSIFKNGNYFVKKEGVVKINNGTFVIPAPANVLMGAYWLSVGKDANIKSILVSEDSFTVETKATSIRDYLRSNINKKITLKEYGYFSDSLGLSGLLLDYDDQSNLVKLQTALNKIIIMDIADFKQLIITDANSMKALRDSFVTMATVKVNPALASTTAATFSLERGIQWYPSYLLRILNDKEARLEMKATIIAGEENFINTDVDIIIGSPEMFYGQQLDPICLGYLHGTIFQPDTYDNNIVSQQVSSSLNTSAFSFNNSKSSSEATPEGDTEGEKLEDLYFYSLGKMDLLKHSHNIIPVMTSTIHYDDIYTADILPTDANSSNEEGIIVSHNFRIDNESTAPLTTGSVLIINQNELPIAQSQLKYTPVKGASDILLSKAIDVKVKNEELENKRETSTKKVEVGGFYDKVFYKGTVDVANYQSKKISVKIKKYILGLPAEAGQAGKIKKASMDTSNDINSSALIEWEVELLPGQKKQLTYSYTSFKK